MPIRSVFKCADYAPSRGDEYGGLLTTLKVRPGVMLNGTVTVLKNGILNPAINSLLSRVRHTNTLVIADRGFPYWPQIETVDISLVDDIPRVLEVLNAVQANFSIGKIVMAEEFRQVNDAQMVRSFEECFGTIPVLFEPHRQFKERVPLAIGVIRTADTVQYANMILESAPR